MKNLEFLDIVMNSKIACIVFLCMILLLTGGVVAGVLLQVYLVAVICGSLIGVSFVVCIVVCLWFIDGRPESTIDTETNNYDALSFVTFMMQQD